MDKANHLESECKDRPEPNDQLIVNQTSEEIQTFTHQESSTDCEKDLELSNANIDEPCCENVSDDANENSLSDQVEPNLELAPKDYAAIRVTPVCKCKHNTNFHFQDKKASRRVFLLGGTYYMDKKFNKRIQKMDSVTTGVDQPAAKEPIDYREKLRIYACPKPIRPIWKTDEVVSWFTVGFILFCIFGYIANIMSEIIIACYLFKKGWYLCFSFSVTFSTVATLIVNFCSYLWYVKEEGLCGYLKPHTFSRTPFERRIYRFVTHVFLTSIIFRQIDILYYAFRIRRELQMLPRSCGNENYFIYARERRDAALLILIESFLRDIPQYALLLFIWVSQQNNWLPPIAHDLFGIAQYLAIVLSIAWFSCSIVNFQQSLRVTRKRKKQFGLMACLLQFVWRLGTTGARIFAIVLVMTAYPGSAFIIILLHWALMSTWILRWKMDVTECPRQNHRSWKICLDRSYACLMGAIYIFCFLNTTNRRSARKLKKFYSVTAAEDTVFVLLWYVKTRTSLPHGESPLWLFGWTAIIYYSAFITGVAAMIIYYKKFHPTTKAVDKDLDAEIQYFNSTLDLVILKTQMNEQENVQIKQVCLKQAVSTASTSSSASASSSSESCNYSTIQHFYTSSYAKRNSRNDEGL